MGVGVEEGEVGFDRMPNIGDVMKEVMIVWEGWLLLTWLFEGAS